MIREALELLTRPMRRKRWEKRRIRLVKANKWWDDRTKNQSLRHEDTPRVADDEHVDFFAPAPIPCHWRERTRTAVKEDVDLWIEEKRERWRTSHDRAHAFLQRVKEGLKEKEKEDEFVEDVTTPDDDDPAFWKVSKEVRDARRRAQLKQMLRKRVPRGWEEGV